MKYRELYITEDWPITAAQKRFFIPESEDDFFVHETIFDGCPGEVKTVTNCECIQVDCEWYVSLNQVIVESEDELFTQAVTLKSALMKLYESATEE